MRIGEVHIFLARGGAIVRRMALQDRAAGRGDVTRRAVLDAAIDRFGRDGFRRTSVTSIARQAGLGSTTTYVHYPTKEALFDAAVEDDLTSLFAKVVEVIDVADPSAGPTALIGLLLVELDRHPLARRLVGGREPELADRVLASGAVTALTLAVTERVVEGQQLGVIRADLAPDVLGDGLISVVIALAMVAEQMGQPLLEQRADGIDAVFQAVLTVPPSGAATR